MCIYQKLYYLVKVIKNYMIYILSLMIPYGIARPEKKATR